jgi:hypothetical protein
MKLDEYLECHKGRHVRTADLLRTIAAEVRAIPVKASDRSYHGYEPLLTRLASRIDAIAATLEPQRREAAE